MFPEWIHDSQLIEGAWAAGTFAAFTLTGLIVSLAMKLAARQLKRRGRESTTADALLALSEPVLLAFFFQGLFLALRTLSYLDRAEEEVAKTNVAVIIVLATFVTARVVAILLNGAARRAPPPSPSDRARLNPFFDAAIVPLLRRTLVVMIYAIGLLIVLDQVGVAITPLVAGLGIGGLAVALALQPALTNFFAGTQIISDQMVRAGDYIELHNGPAGYVLEVGWRSTRIRTPFNNIVIIPNSQLSESILTNYYSPTQVMAVMVRAGVSFESDLTRVEALAREIAQEVIEELPEGVPGLAPLFGYDRIGDSNVEFWVWVHATDRIASFRVTSELIRRIHVRFRQEGIVISHPVRRILLPASDGRVPDVQVRAPSPMDE